MKKNTKEIIVKRALEIFNEKGSHSVTTNHIADACGISPGNLYYHFKNKEEIIREIFSLITGEFSLIWSESTHIGEELTSFISKTRTMGDIYYRYRFFYLELPSLLSQDSELAKCYHENESEKHRIIAELIRMMAANRMIKAEIGDAEIEAIVSSSWVLTDFWLSYLYVSGEAVTPENVMRGMDNYLYFITPHLSQKGLKFLKAAMDKPQ